MVPFLIAGLVFGPLAVASPLPDAVDPPPQQLVGAIEAAETSLRNGRPREALRVLEAYRGPKHPYLDLFLGHARFDLGDREAALAAYGRALEVAPRLTAARLGQARALGAIGRWAQVTELLSPWVEAETSPAAALGLLGRAALETGDLRRASLLAERGILRFPEVLAFRRLDTAVLLERHDWRRAGEAAQSVLARAPLDAVAWSQLAAAQRKLADETERRAALEAAHLSDPSDDSVFARHLQAQFDAGHHPEAVRLVRIALDRPALRRDGAFVELAVRTAEAAEVPELGRRWLSLVPPSARSRILTLLEARLALATNNTRAARTALERLIKNGETSAAVFVRAGKLAEDDGRLTEAEGLYAQASTMEGEAARYAELALARLYLRTKQRERAEDTLQRYLANHPDDRYARQLLRFTVRASR